MRLLALLLFLVAPCQAHAGEQLFVPVGHVLDDEEPGIELDIYKYRGMRTKFPFLVTISRHGHPVALGGVVGSRSVVVTNAHVFYGKDGKLLAPIEEYNIVWGPPLGAEAEVHSIPSIRSITFGSTTTKQSAERLDFAVVKLEKPIARAVPLELPLDIDDMLSRDRRFEMVTMRRGVSEGGYISTSQLAIAGRLLDEEDLPDLRSLPNLAAYEKTTYPTSSGSPGVLLRNGVVFLGFIHKGSGQSIGRLEGIRKSHGHDVNAEGWVQDPKAVTYNIGVLARGAFLEAIKAATR